MPSSIYPIDPPIGGLTCCNCAESMLATAKVFDGGMSIQGLREYRYTHAHGSETCRPTTKAQPYDGWRATAIIEAALAARAATEEALEAALCPGSGRPTEPLN
jgi:hypothetical protein